MCPLLCVAASRHLIRNSTSDVSPDILQSKATTVAIENEMKNVVSSLVSPNKVVITS